MSIGFKLDIFDIYSEIGYWLNEDEFILYDWVSRGVIDVLGTINNNYNNVNDSITVMVSNLYYGR